MAILDFAYTITLYDALGARLTQLNEYEEFDCTRRENEIGELEISLPNIYDRDLFEVDRIIDIERTISGRTYVDGETYWYIRKWRYEDDRDGRERLILVCKDTNHLLDRRIIAYNAGSAFADKTDFADDMMKEIIDENYGSGATDTTRDISTYLTIQADASAAPSISKAFSRRMVIDALREIADDSLENGTYLVFDCARTAPGFAEFRTYPGQRGVDHGSSSGDQRVVSKERGNLTNASIEFDYEDMANYVYAGGQGEGANRVIKTALDQSSINKSPVNRIEYFEDARNAFKPATVQAEANQILQGKRARIRFDGEITDTDNFRYGIDYGYGDIVTAEYQGYSIDCHVDTVRIVVKGGREIITARIRGEILI